MNLAAKIRDYASELLSAAAAGVRHTLPNGLPVRGAQIQEDPGYDDPQEQQAALALFDALQDVTAECPYGCYIVRMEAKETPPYIYAHVDPGFRDPFEVKILSSGEASWRSAHLDKSERVWGTDTNAPEYDLVVKAIEILRENFPGFCPAPPVMRTAAAPSSLAS